MTDRPRSRDAVRPTLAAPDLPQVLVRSEAEWFHLVNHVLPEGQELVSIPPEMPAGVAVQLMNERGFSQIPVKANATVLGLFSYRAFALEVARMGGRGDPAALPVEEFLEHERPVYARLTDEFRRLIDDLDAHDVVVVSGPGELIGVVTPMDVLRYLYSIANAFVLIEEIELALRSLIRVAISEDRLRECIEWALTRKYANRDLPTRLEDMTFDDYVSLLGDGRSWPHFQSVFGGTRDRVRSRLEPVAKLRNTVFHFRRELSAVDHECLTTCRDWVRRCVLKVQGLTPSAPTLDPEGSSARGG